MNKIFFKKEKGANKRRIIDNNQLGFPNFTEDLYFIQLTNGLKKCIRVKGYDLEMLKQYPKVVSMLTDKNANVLKSYRFFYLIRSY